MVNLSARGFIPALIICLFLMIPCQSAFANGYDEFPGPIAWSPDSSMFAVAYPTEFNGYNFSGELFVFDKYGREKLNLGDGYSSPSFRHDGEKLAAILGENVVVYELENPTEPVDLGTTDAIACSWGKTIDGASMLFVSLGQRFGSSEIYVLDTKPDGFTQLTNTNYEAACVSAVVSPDGSYVAYTRQPGDEGLFGYERVWFVDSASGDATKAAPEQTRQWDYHESNPVWAGNETLIFQRGGWGDWNIYRTNVVTGKEFLELTDAQQASLSADGRWMGFTRRDYETKLDEEYDWEIPPAVWVMDRDERLIYQVSKPGVTAQHPAVSPDGKYIAWLETSSDGEMIVKVKRIMTIAHP